MRAEEGGVTVEDTTEEQEDVEPEEASEAEQQEPQPQAFAHPLSNLPPELDVCAPAPGRFAPRRPTPP